VHNIARAAMLQLQIPPDAPGRVDWDDHLTEAARSNSRSGQQASRGPADFSRPADFSSAVTP
jgi:hypothetical protein